MVDGTVPESFVVASTEAQVPKGSSSDRGFEGPSQSQAAKYRQAMPLKDTAIRALGLQIMPLQVSSLQCHAILE
jgi:hypothetical protein